MRIVCLQHEPHEAPGAIAVWCRKRGHELAVTSVFAGSPLPVVDGSDAILLMGGGMGANDDDRYPWLAEEKRFIERCLLAGGKMVGVCLGAQLIAAASGARVYRNPHKEIGWFPVDLTPAGRRSPLFEGWPDSFTALHWHGDTFDLPAGAVHLASSAATERQAFLLGGRALGLQFHPELDAPLLESFMAENPAELAAAEFVQPPAEIRAGFHRLPGLNGLLERLLDSFFSDVK